MKRLSIGTTLLTLILLLASVMSPLARLAADAQDATPVVGNAEIVETPVDIATDVPVATETAAPEETVAVTPSPTEAATEPATVEPTATATGTPAPGGSVTATPSATGVPGGAATPDASGATPVADGASSQDMPFEAALAQDDEVSAAALTATPTDLGSAMGFNLFVLGDMSGVNGDTEGCLAVGGNLSLQSWGVNNHGVSCPSALVVGGNGTGSGEVDGNTTYGGIFSGINVKNGSASQGTTTYFNDAEEYFNALSGNLVSQPVSGTATVQPWGAMTLTANPGAGTTVVFTIDSATLPTTTVWLDGKNQTMAKISQVDFSGIPAGATVIVNITGTTPVVFTQGQMSSPDKQKVLFNMPDATNVGMTGYSIQGSLLAPNATFIASNGNLEGQGVFQ
ncbi:MAG: collagen-binding domain-containing protein, partial [Thermomicrobiales bacterium]